MKKVISVLLLLVWVVTLSACNTMAGVGEDIQSAGEKLEDAAKKNR